MTRRTLSLIAMVLLLVPALALAADDALKAAPKKFKVLFENDEVRVLEYTAKAGDKIATHTHPAHVLYSLSTGKTRFTMSDGSKREMDIKNGEARWSDPVTHSQEAVTDAHAIVVELKKQKKAKK